MKNWQKPNGQITVASLLEAYGVSIGSHLAQHLGITKMEVTYMGHDGKESCSYGGYHGGINPVIAEVFTQTAEAMVVQEFMGFEIPNTFTMLLMLKANKDLYLKEAYERQARAKKKSEGQY